MANVYTARMQFWLTLLLFFKEFNKSSTNSHYEWM